LKQKVSIKKAKKAMKVGLFDRARTGWIEPMIQPI